MNSPYLRFGKIIQELRKRLHESKKELCLTLEINEQLLTSIENGETQPTEEIVDQLANHFNLDESSANNLWQLAGYSDNSSAENSSMPVYVPLPDLKISYTDLVHVTVNKFGLVLNFMQGTGINNQPMIVSRLGMSREHALSIVEVMVDALKKSVEQDRKKNPKKNTLGLPERSSQEKSSKKDQK